MPYFLLISSRLVNTIIGVYICYTLGSSVLERRIGRQVVLITAGAFLAYVLILIFTGFSSPSRAYFLCIHPVVLITLITVCKAKILPALMSLFLSFLFLGPSMFVFIISNYIVVKYAIPIDKNILINLCYLFGPIVLSYPCTVRLIPMLRPIVQKRSRNLLFVLLFSTVYYLFGVYFSVTRDNISDAAAVSIVFFLLLFVAFCIIGILYLSQKEVNTMEIDRREMLLHTEAMQRQLELFTEMQEYFRAVRHDQRHFLHAIAGYADIHEIQKIKQLVSQNIEELNASEIIPFCQNVSINMILSDFACRARQKHIEFNADADIPCELLMREIDLVVIFSNALENSLQALEKIPESGKKEVTVSCKTDRTTGQLKVDIQNKISGSVSFDYRGLPESTKGSGHGYGTKRIVQAVERNNGLWKFSLENEIFAFQAVFFSAVRPVYND